MSNNLTTSRFCQPVAFPALHPCLRSKAWLQHWEKLLGQLLQLETRCQCSPGCLANFESPSWVVKPRLASRASWEGGFKLPTYIPAPTIALPAQFSLSVMSLQSPLDRTSFRGKQSLHECSQGRWRKHLLLSNPSSARLTKAPLQLSCKDCSGMRLSLTAHVLRNAANCLLG